MVVHVVFDLLRRHRWMLLGVAVVSTMMLRLMLALMPSNVAGLGLLVTGMLGLHLITSGLSKREIWIRPISTRELWLCRWSTAAVVMPAFWLACGTVANLLVLVFGRAGNWEPLVLSTIYVSLVGATFVTLIPAVDIGVRQAPPTKSIPGFVLRLVAMLAGIGMVSLVPFVLGPRLPHHFAALSTAWLLGLVAASAAAGVGWRWTPPGPAIPDHARRVSAMSPPPISRRSHALLDGLTGPMRLLVPAAGIGFGLTMLVVGVGAVGDWFLAEEDITLLQSISPRDSAFVAAIPALCLMSPWLGFHRLLHTLPMSTWRRLGWLFAGPMTVMSAAWLALFIAYWIASGTPPQTLEPAFWFFVVCTGIASQAVISRWNLMPEPLSPKSNKFGAALGVAIGSMSILRRIAQRTPDEYLTITFVGTGIILLIVALKVHRGGAPYNRRPTHPIRASAQ